jgi:hypothetical protein
MSELPQAESADPDAVQMALQAAHTLWSRGETTESLRWLKRAAESASDEGADLRSLQLAKAAAELRAKLFSGNGASNSAPAGGAEPAAASGSGRDSERPPSGAPASRPGAAASPGAALRGEESSPGSVRPPGTQYVVHRPREAQRQLMGLSSTTLETARNFPESAASERARNGSSPPSVPSWSAGTEVHRSSPPPLPHPSLDDYEELDAEPDEDSDARAGAWTPSSPPPLPDAAAAGRGLAEEEEGEDMREEPRTVVLPPKDEGSSPGRELLPSNQSAWDSEARLAAWDSAAGPEAGWGTEDRSSGWIGASAPLGSSAVPEAVPAKLTARVHHQAVRVACLPDPRNPGQYIVRPLREGERAPAGERVALLVALEPGVPLV